MPIPASLSQWCILRVFSWNLKPYFCFNLFLLSPLASCVICGKVRSTPLLLHLRFELSYFWCFRFPQRYPLRHQNLNLFFFFFSNLQCFLGFFGVFWEDPVCHFDWIMVFAKSTVKYSYHLSSFLFSSHLLSCHIFSSSAKPSENTREWTWHYSDLISSP